MSKTKFKVGDKIIRIEKLFKYSYTLIPYRITSIKNSKYVVSNSNGVKNLHLGLTEYVDDQFELEEIVNSPLYSIMREDDA